MSFEKVKSVFREKCIPYGNWWFYPLGLFWWISIMLIILVLPGMLFGMAENYSSVNDIVFNPDTPLISMAGDWYGWAANLSIAFIGFLLGSAVPDLLRRFWVPAAGKNAAKE